MIKSIFSILLFLLLLGANVNAGESGRSEVFGRTLNIGLGVGYYRYVGHTFPLLNINYELSVAKSFTLAPFVSFYSYSNEYYWGNKDYPYRYYSYRETAIPIGLKGAYYFDNLLNARSDWDFYLGGSVGFAIVTSSWDDNYYGDKNYYHNPNPFYLDLHLGTEYHINNKIGIYLDLSTGVSTIGIAIH